MSKENRLWGAPRIHGELLKLGFEIAGSTVSKYMIRRRGPPSQTWRTFLRNIKNLGTLGIEATLRLVDPVQYRKRVDDFDFDLTIQRFAFSSTPGDSLRSYFSSQAAAMKGSQNLAGISDPVIDALIDKIIAADRRTSLTTACRVLDRVIRAGRYWVPHWYKASHWLAYWDVFGRPATKPRYARGIPETWWYDRDKAATIDQ
jgi:microcin C transport system substrate-binding protein